VTKVASAEEVSFTYDISSFEYAFRDFLKIRNQQVNARERIELDKKIYRLSPFVATIIEKLISKIRD